MRNISSKYGTTVIAFITAIICYTDEEIKRDGKKSRFTALCRDI